MIISTYIVATRFKSKAICGEINLPYATPCTCINNLISYNNKPICYTTSQNAYDYFAPNDDGRGLERGKLIKSIIKTLAKPDSQYQARWDKVWADNSIHKYKRSDEGCGDDYWLWNYDFYHASIEDLQYIYNLIK